MINASQPQSVLFADVSGSVRLHEKLGDAETLRAVDRCLKRMERSVEVFGGYIIKTVGDELMAMFDLPDQAFQAALQMQERVADLPPVSGVKLAIRIGFAHGSVSEERGRVVGETVSVAAHLAGLAKPGQVLTSFQTQSELPPALKKSTRSLGPASASGQFPGMMVIEVLSPEEAKLRAPFCLRYGDKLIELNESKLTIKMGRDAQSDVAIHDRRASRHHAKIERRGELIFLIDSSTNGTYVTLDGEAELFLREAECIIHGKGQICFAASASSPDADCAEFE
ncbi:adenylate/guanylate cyclase domain-containing protein [Propionivibrio sp.]|uniref:adenylate/guanylate cyclase domain-containing protein n=1 Tax=Propionivibrio sp. TaxID=2212460 RepID=UPI002638C6BF|nr:adenylate/guanylate cyclase domain-containing protein [Propionivibrio sp.]